MSTETTNFDSPWDDTDTPAPENAFDVEDPFENGDFDFDFSETETGQAVQVREARNTYDDPRDVGLKDKMWVPIRLESVEVDEKHIPRLSASTCIARAKDGKISVQYDQVEAALRDGAEEIVGEFKLPYFVATANHVAPSFGSRPFPYEIEVPVLTVKTAYHKGPRNGRTGFRNENGRSLRQASGATRTGDEVTRANMHEVAAAMSDKIVMAQLSLVEGKRARQRRRFDADGKPITVLVDPNSGTPVAIQRVGEGQYVYAESGEVWEGNENLLVPLTTESTDKFAIRDNGDYSDVLMESFTPFVDYINPPFQPVPERRVTVETLETDEDGTPIRVEGDITWETVGAITLGKAPGAMVDVLLVSGKRMGQTISALWLGTQWNEVPQEGDGLDQFTGSPA